jgi:hypothetical protein
VDDGPHFGTTGTDWQAAPQETADFAGSVMDMMRIVGMLQLAGGEFFTIAFRVRW